MPDFQKTINSMILTGGNSNLFFYFHPEHWGKILHFDKHIIFFKGVGSTSNQFTSKSPNIENPQNGWFTVENLIKMDDLGVPLFSETSTRIRPATNAGPVSSSAPARRATARSSRQVVVYGDFFGVGTGLSVFLKGGSIANMHRKKYIRNIYIYNTYYILCTYIFF